MAAVAVNSTYILQEVSGRVAKVHIEEITEYTILFQDMDNPSSPSVRILKSQFDNVFKVLEIINNA